MVVGVNHRLNVFGHLDVSAFGEKFRNSCNAGIADLVVSLEWVKANIIESPNPKKFVLDIMNKLNIQDESIEKLQKVPCKLLIMAVNHVINDYAKLGIFVNWEPKPNGWYVGNPLLCGFRDHFKQIPTIVGSTITEFNSHDPIPVSDKEQMDEEVQKQVVYAKYGRKIGDEIINRYKKAYSWKKSGLCGIYRLQCAPGIHFCKSRKSKWRSG